MLAIYPITKEVSEIISLLERPRSDNHAVPRMLIYILITFTESIDSSMVFLLSGITVNVTDIELGTFKYVESESFRRSEM
jgi:hypothetical protein